MKPLEILSIGLKHPQNSEPIEFSAEDLGAIATAFNLAGKPVPFVPGHPPDDQPVLGKGVQLAAKSGRLLVTQYAEVDPTFKGIVNSGEMPGISVKLRLPSHPQNKSGTYELRHVGFLGRSLPADTTIADAQFSLEEGEIILMAKQEKPQADLPDEATTSNEPSTSPQSLTTQEAEFTQRLEALERREAIFSKAQEINPYIEGLIGEGKVMPDEKAGLVALFSQLPNSLEIEFKRGDEVVQAHPEEFLKGFLSRLPKRIEYAELSGGKLPTPTTDPAALAEKIEAYKSAQAAKGNEVSFAAASSYIRQHPDWTAS